MEQSQRLSTAWSVEMRPLGFLLSEYAGGIEWLTYVRGDGSHLADMAWAVHDSSISQLVQLTPSLSGSGLYAQMCFHPLPNPPFVYPASTSWKSFLLLPTKTMAVFPAFNSVLDTCLPALLLWLVTSPLVLAYQNFSAAKGFSHFGWGECLGQWIPSTCRQLSNRWTFSFRKSILNISHFLGS